MRCGRLLLNRREVMTSSLLRLLVVAMTTSLVNCHPQGKLWDNFRLTNQLYPVSKDFSHLDVTSQNARGKDGALFFNSLLVNIIQDFILGREKHAVNRLPPISIHRTLLHNFIGPRIPSQKFYSLDDVLRNFYLRLGNHVRPDIEFSISRQHPSLNTESKRTLRRGVAHSVCPHRVQWLQLHSARDINETQVEVFQPRVGSEGRQWFYTVQCDHAHPYLRDSRCPTCCRGVDHTAFTSQCLTRKSYVMALTKRSDEWVFTWNWIQVNTSCNCAITARSPS